MKRLLCILAMLVGTAALAQNTPTVGALPDNGPSLPATCVIGQVYFRTAVTIGLNQCNPANVWTALGTGSGTVTSVTGTAPITSSGGTTPAIGCATCAIGPGASTANHIAKFSGTDGLTLIDGGLGSAPSWDQITNAAANLTLANGTFTTTFNQTAAANWTWANTTAATSGTAQSSPIVNINGNYWTGAASAVDSWTMQNVIASGTNGASKLTFTHTGTPTTAGTGIYITPLGTNCVICASGLSNTGMGFGSGNFYVLVNGTEPLQVVATGVFPAVPVCDFNTNNNCLTLGSNSMSITGTGSPNGQIERGFNVNVTPVTVSTSTTNDQNLMAVTLPANNLNVVGRTYRVFAAGVYSTPAASAATLTFEIKICSVSGCASGNVADVIDITSSANPGSVTNNAWNLTAYVTTQTASTAGAWESHGVLGIDLGALTTSADSFFNDTNTATVTGTPSAIDTTAQNFLQISVAFSAASASNSATQRQLVVEVVN